MLVTIHTANEIQSQVGSILILNYEGKWIICINRVIYSKIRLKIAEELLNLSLHAGHKQFIANSGDFRGNKCKIMEKMWRKPI